MDPGLARVAQITREVEDVMSGMALTRIQRYVGGRSKALALGHAAKDLGGDRAMSNFRGGRLRLGAGWDAMPSGIAVNFRPAGFWKLADEGRKRSGTIRPRRKKALATPDGVRSLSHYHPSRGLKTFQDSERDIERSAARNTDAAIARELRRIVG